MTRIVTSRGDAKRIAHAVRRVERMPYNEQPQGRGGGDGAIELHPIRITSTTQTAGRYPGTLYTYDADADSYTVAGTAGDIWVDTPNGEALTVGNNYWAKLAGVESDDGKLIYQAVGGFESSTPELGGALVVLTANATIAFGATSATLSFTNETYDTDDYHDNTTNPSRLTVAETGRYQLNAGIIVDGTLGASGAVNVRFGVNGAGTVYGLTLPMPSNINAYFCITGNLLLTAGDYAEVLIRNDCAGSITVLTPSYFSITRLA